MKSFSHLDRDEALKTMADKVFDVVVIGGGITGAGVARDAASRGMSVALIEAKDFAVGTSSRSSKLIHGGIRYLENLEFKLVFEALSERRTLFEMAPHLVHPLRFVLPLYRNSRVSMFKMGLGMWLYDVLSLLEAPELHERLTPGESIERLPLLKAEGLAGAYVYSDASMDDDRLVTATLRSAHELGACCAHYVAADDAEIVDGEIRSIGCSDQLTGKRFRLRGRHFVSTVGPWTDLVASRLLHQWRPLLRPTKGIHLTFDRQRLPLNQAVVMAADQEKRIIFAIPRHDMILLGTTDTDYAGDPYEVNTSREDVEYLLKIAAEYFPGASLGEQDIVASYAGVRPLVDDTAESESKTSREHVIFRDPRGITFVAGGKYTTYRLMAEQTMKTVLQAFPLEDQVRFGRNNTKIPLSPLATKDKLEAAQFCSTEWAREFGLSASNMDFLIARHGAEARSLLERAQSFNSRQGLAERERLWEIEAHQAIDHTMCVNLVDFYWRRSPLFLAYGDHGLPVLNHISQVFAERLGWNDSRRYSEVEALNRQMEIEQMWRRQKISD